MQEPLLLPWQNPCPAFPQPSLDLKAIPAPVSPQHPPAGGGGAAAFMTEELRGEGCRAEHG